MHKIRMALLLVILTAIHNIGLANNGQMAVTWPSDNAINIDGDLSDWPKDIIKYPIKLAPSGEEIEPSADFSSHFSVSYKENNQQAYLYFALTIVDDQKVASTSDNDLSWDNKDSFIFYIDSMHSTRGSGSLLFLFNDGVFEAMDTSSSWDPNARSVNESRLKYATSIVNNKMIVEFSFALEQKSRINSTLGIDFVFVDTDANDKSGIEDKQFIVWGKSLGKSRSANNLGDLLILAEPSKLATIKGKLLGDFHSSGTSYVNRLRVENTQYPMLRTSAMVNPDGSYKVMLPEGNYKITNGRLTIGNPWNDLLALDQNAHVLVKATAEKEMNAPDLEIKSLTVPDLIGEKGLLMQVGDRGFTQTQKQKLSKDIHTYLEHFKVPGASVAIVKDDKIIYHETFGYKNYFTKEKVSNNTLFEAASITKAVFAVAVNSLVDKGMIDLDKPLFQYLPFPEIAHDERYKKITARHVLGHRTGFPNWAWMNDDGKINIKFEPGSDFGYSGEGFEYLGRVVAQITGKTIEEVIMQEVQIPFGYVNNAHFSNNELVSNNVANGHYRLFAAPIQTPSAIGVAHSLQTEAKAFSQFMLGLINKKQLSTNAYNQMLSEQSFIPSDPDEAPPKFKQYYGLGLAVYDTPLGKLYGHGGNNGDFTSIFEILDEHNVGYVIFTNNDTGAAFHQHMQDYLLFGKNKG